MFSSVNNSTVSNSKEGWIFLHYRLHLQCKRRYWRGVGRIFLLSYKQSNQNQNKWTVDKDKFHHLTVAGKQVYNSREISMPYRNTKLLQ